MPRKLIAGCGGLLLAALAIPTVRADELIRNGDFEKGNQEFFSDYKYAPGNIRPEMTYDIATDPKKSHEDAPSFGDHTTGKGFMMVINGGNSPNKVLWGHTVKVLPGAEYRFSLWLTPWYAPAPAQLNIQINGKSIGKITAGAKCGEWKEFRARWNSGTDKVAAIKIYNLTTEMSGNDFALDDISLQGPPPGGPK